MLQGKTGNFSTAQNLPKMAILCNPKLPFLATYGYIKLPFLAILHSLKVANFGTFKIVQNCQK